MKKDLVEILSIFDKNKTIGEILTTLGKEVEIGQKQTQELGLELVDLGLPSGNLWMKCNLGDKTETDYGNYYQFGSLKGYQGEEALNHSTWKTCPFNNGQDNFDKKYFLKNKYNWFDKDDNLKPEYDAVTQTYGPDFKIPTNEDFQELLDNTITKTVEDYNNPFNDGRLFISKVNGNSIFIPFSGDVWNGNFNGIGVCGDLWSGRRIPNASTRAYFFVNYSDDVVLGCNDRCCGFAIRGIKVRGN